MKKEIIIKILKALANGFCIVIIIGCSVALFVSGGAIGSFLTQRNHWSVEASEQEFDESNKELRNP